MLALIIALLVSYASIYAVNILNNVANVQVLYISTQCRKGITEATRQTLIIYCAGEEQSTEIHQFIKTKLDAHSRINTSRLFVILNPLGGERRALQVYHQIVQPMLSAAGIALELAKTEYSLHAKLLANELNLSQYQGLVVIGGDGLVHEVVNGLMFRKDWRVISQELPIGLIPAGTSNAVARSLGISDPVYATFCIIKQATRLFDAVLYEQGDRRFYGHVAFMWGLVADIDIGSNSCRWMGHSRLFWVTLARILQLRRYHALIRYVDADKVESQGLDFTETDAGDRPPARYKSLFTSNGHPLVEKLDDREYYSVIAVKHAYLDRDFFVSQRVDLASSQDVVHMFLVPAPGINRWDFLKALFASDGTMIHDEEKWTKYVRARAAGISFHEQEASIVDVDGELIPKMDIYMESIPNVLCYFVPPSS